jgi:cobalamin synthase
MQRIDGWTGDTAGASIEVTELLALLVLSMAL